jgi:hypothetical protein
MSATSATGTGYGGAWNNKGPHNGRDIYVSSVDYVAGPQFVRAGVATLADGSSKSLVTVHFTSLEGNDSDYIVIATIVGATAAIAAGGVAVSALDVSAGTFVLTSADTFTNDVNWVIVKL